MNPSTVMIPLVDHSHPSLKIKHWNYFNVRNNWKLNWEEAMVNFEITPNINTLIYITHYVHMWFCWKINVEMLNKYILAPTAEHHRISVITWMYIIVADERLWAIFLTRGHLLMLMMHTTLAFWHNLLFFVRTFQNSLNFKENISNCCTGHDISLLGAAGS